MISICGGTGNGPTETRSLQVAGIAAYIPAGDAEQTRTPSAPAAAAASRVGTHGTERARPQRLVTRDRAVPHTAHLHDIAVLVTADRADTALASLAGLIRSRPPAVALPSARALFDLDGTQVPLGRRLANSPS